MRCCDTPTEQICVQTAQRAPVPVQSNGTVRAPDIVRLGWNQVSARKEKGTARHPVQALAIRR